MKTIFPLDENPALNHKGAANTFNEGNPMEFTVSRPEFWALVEMLIKAAHSSKPFSGESDARNAVAAVLAGHVGVSIEDDATSQTVAA